MSKLILLVGPPGSGKSSIATKFEELEGFVRVSQDDQGKQGHIEAFERALSEGKDIVVDRMNFDKKQRDRYLIPAKEVGYSTDIVVLHVPYQTCLERVLARENHPTIKSEGDAKSALNTFFSKYERVQDSEADVVHRRGWENASDEKTLICDIDGCIANIEHRRKHVDRTLGKPDWGKFFGGMENDIPNEWCVDLVKSLWQPSPGSIGYTIIFASGRPNSYRQVTEDWLARALGVNLWKGFYMRPRSDHRADDIVKEIILEFLLKPRHSSMIFIDDRRRVVDLWRRHGYVCLQCDPGEF